MLECVGIVFLLFAAAVFLYEKHLCSKIDEQLSRIEKLVEEAEE